MATRKNTSSGGPSLLSLGLLAVGGYFVYEWFFATPATAATTTTPVTPATTTPVTSTPAATTSAPATSTTAAPAAFTLDSLYAAMLASIAAHNDPAFTGTADNLSSSAWEFGTYLNVVDPSLTVPDPSVVFGSQTAATGPMTAASYWSLMGPALRTANAGLSGDCS